MNSLLPKPSGLLTVASLAVLALTSPVVAQDQAGDRVNLVIAYSEDECPEPTQEGEIVVCQIVVEAERYRIPSNLRQSDSPENRTLGQRFDQIRYIGDFGTLSCDPAGAGGFTGCTQKLIDSAFADRATGENVRFSELIEQARQERLSTIDADAAAEQERVEQIEREYLERLEREREGPVPGEVDPSLTPPPIDAEARAIPAEPTGPGGFGENDDVQVPLGAAPVNDSGS